MHEIGTIKSRVKLTERHKIYSYIVHAPGVSAI